MDEDQNVIEESNAQRIASDIPSELTDRELAEETLRLVRETHAAMLGTQQLVQGVVAEVGPMVESFANNPMLKTLGFGKKFGK